MLLHCDNKADVDMVTGLSAKKPKSCFLLRELHTLMVQFGFLLRAVHRPGALNTLADALSRNDVDTFIRLAPYPHPFLHLLGLIVNGLEGLCGAPASRFLPPCCGKISCKVDVDPF